MSHDYLWQPRDPDSTADTTFADAREAIEAVRIGDLFIDRHHRSPMVLERAKAAAQQLCEAWDAQAECDHLRRALEWAAVRDRVGVRTALAATEEAQP